MPTTTRDKSGFTLASHQSQALCLGTLGISGLLWPIAVWGFGSPLRFLAGWAAAGGGVWLLMKARDRWRLHGLEEGFGGGFVEGSPVVGMELTPENISAVHSSLPPEVLENAQYQRLRNHVEEPGPGSQRKPWGAVTSAQVEDGQLVSYVIVTIDGFLTNKKIRTEKLAQLEELLDAGADNRWEIRSVPTDDLVVGKLVKDVLPRAIAPEPPTSAVIDLQDATRRYEKARWVLGVDAQGKEVSYALDGGIPHVLVAGGTGGGKSVWARTIIEMFRVEGFTCFIASGKETDFAALNGLPGIGMVAEGPAETAVMCRTIRKEMNRRYRHQRDVMTSTGDKTFDYPPILMLLDEWGATEIDMRSRYKKSDPFLKDVDLILRKGRECKIHVVLLSQNIRKTGDGAVPGSWQGNLKLTISLGDPEEVTLQSDAFTESTRGEARRIGPKLKGKPGRGLTAERETGRVVEFQSYYGWSPGTTSMDPNADRKVAAPNEEVRAVWDKWVPISASVPVLMPRLGIKAEGPEWDEGELEDVASTPIIALTDESGNLIPENEKFDPRSTEWIGESLDGDFEGIGFKN